MPCWQGIMPLPTTNAHTSTLSLQLKALPFALVSGQVTCHSCLSQPPRRANASKAFVHPYVPARIPALARPFRQRRQSILSRSRLHTVSSLRETARLSPQGSHCAAHTAACSGQACLVASRHLERNAPPSPLPSPRRFPSGQNDIAIQPTLGCSSIVCRPAP